MIGLLYKITELCNAINNKSLGKKPWEPYIGRISYVSKF